MMELSILLLATDPSRNVHRSYHIVAGQDLFGNWIVETTYGRTGSKGRTMTFEVKDRDCARAYVRSCLMRRAGAKKRIGVPYKAVSINGIGEWTESLPLPSGIGYDSKVCQTAL
jgi:predicted DNA-binding WGR domain protein